MNTGIFGRSLALATLASAVVLSPACYDGLDSDGELGASESGIDGDRLEITRMAILASSVQFKAGEESITLELEPNTDLLAHDATVIRDGETMSITEAGIDIPFRGQVAGDPESWVRVHKVGNQMEGLIFKDHELWEVRQDDDGGLWMSAASIDDYLDSPTNSHYQCANTSENSKHASYSKDPADSAAKAACSQVRIALVSDFSHVAALGGSNASENEMVYRINESDGIFRDDLNYGFSINSIQSYSSPGGPSFNSSNSGSTPLEQFSSFKQSQYPNMGLAHLFVARTTSGTVGKAWVGATCSAYYGAGVSNYLGTGKSSTIVAAHEIGHNFGSGHDNSGAPFVMAPSVNSSATQFSNSSESQINSHVASVSCFEPCGSNPNPNPNPATCEGSCGGQSPQGCWCDDQCSTYGDCCSDYETECVAPPPPGPTCDGSCGGQSPDGCWCDAQCTSYGDCCPDYAAEC